VELNDWGCAAGRRYKQYPTVHAPWSHPIELITGPRSPYGRRATLYELSTGAPPFGSGDPLQLTHDHLARVPVPPAQVNPAVPKPLSDIVLHLLEKEPDNRYQTADGVLYDLHRLRTAPADALRVGQHDVPLQLRPARLMGREDEVAALQAAFDGALAGECRAVLIGGAPGVGKTALVDELRSVVTAGDGWFVAGKFDQYRREYPVRFTDLDLFDHMNNAVYWSFIEDYLSTTPGLLKAPLRVTIEHETPVALGDKLEIIAHTHPARSTDKFGPDLVDRAVTTLTYVVGDGTQSARQVADRAMRIEAPVSRGRRRGAGRIVRCCGCSRRGHR
jgi:hypothetical protein